MAEIDNKNSVSSPSAGDSERKGNRSIAFGGAIGYLGFFLNIVFGVIFTPWAASVLKDYYGIYTIALSLISMLMVDFGLSTTINVFLSKYRSSHDEAQVAKCVQTTFKIFLLLDALLFVVFAVVFFCLPYMYSDPVEWTPDRLNALRYSYLIVASFSVLSFPGTVFSGIITSFERFTALKITDVATKVFYVALSSASLLVLPAIGQNDLCLYALVLANCLSTLAVTIWKYLIIRLKLKIRVLTFEKLDLKYAKEIAGYSIFSAIIGLSSRLIFTIVPIILGATAGPIASGTFGFISTIEGYIFTFGAVLNGFFIPKISRINSGEDAPDKLEKLAIKVGRFQLILIGLIIVGFACCGKEFCAIWMSSSGMYDSNIVYYGILIICVYQVVHVPQMVLDSAMMTKRKGIMSLAILYLSRGVINVGLAFALSSSLGVLGACLSIAVVRTIELIISNVLYSRILRVSVFRFFAKTYLPLLPAIAISLAGGLALHFLLPRFFADTMARFLIIGFAVVLLFGVFAYFGMPKETRNRITSKVSSMLFRTFDKAHHQENKLDGSKRSGLIVTIGLCAGVALVVIQAAYFVVLPYLPFGISGTYSLVYEGRLREKIQVNANNTLLYSEYDGDSNPIYVDKPFYWSLDYSPSAKEEGSGLPVATLWLLQVRINSYNGPSTAQFFYNDQGLFSRRLITQYGSQQVHYARSDR